MRETAIWITLGSRPAMSNLESLELEVEQANLRFYRAFETLDIRQMEKVWAVNKPVKCIHPGWTLRSGWPAVRDSWVIIFNHTSEIQFEISDAEIVVEKDLGWITCTEMVTHIINGKPQVSHVLATNLYSRQKMEWLLIHHHGSPIF